MVTLTDFLGREWKRVSPIRLECSDGNILYVSDGSTDEQAMESLFASYLQQRRTELDAAVEAHIDATARGAGFVSMERAAGYTTSSRHGAKAQALVDWRDDVWDHCRAVEDAVVAGQRSIPTEAELIAELPRFGA